MKKRRKRVISGIVVLVSIVVVVFLIRAFRCPGESDILWTSDWLEVRWFNANGAFEFDGNLLYYYNPQSGKRVVACNKAGCRHEDEDCPAYADGMYGITFTSTGLMYFSPISNRADAYGLYQAGSDGTNLREIHRFRDVQWTGDIKYYGNQVLFCYSNSLDEDGNTLEEPESGIIGYDLESGEEKKIFTDRKVASHISALAYHEGVIYFIYRYSDMTGEEALEHAEDQEYAREREHFVLGSVSTDGGDYRVISEEIDSAVNLSVVEDVLYVCKKDGAYAYDTKENTMTRVKEGIFDMVPVYRNGKQGLLLRDMESAGDAKVYWYLDHGTFRKIAGGEELCLSVNEDYAWFMDGEGKWMTADAGDFLNGKKFKFVSY